MESLAKAAGMSVYTGATVLKKKMISTSDISRPGLELTGYFDYYPAERIQLLGMTEISYARKMTAEDRVNVMEKLCADPTTPCFVISRYLPVPEELERAAKKNEIPILRSKLSTTRVLSKMTDFLESQLAERKSMHGVLVDIYGLGVLITGDSGVGKSETALDLIKRGHRLIADDRVEVYQKDEQTIVGEAPKILNHLLEIRGIGIIDVMNLFGAGAVRAETDISLIVHLENWSPDKQFERLGTGEQKVRLFDVDIPKITIPVKIGRNLAIIIEAAAMNYRARTMGYDATEAFENNLNNLIKNNSN
ncbi:HPr kinase phosphorylase [Liquorilactobacillus sucicola DSM 21376 = JCM 15457]|uniref:HPr kinase/phosphorylase n=1 Tax=Liquorilactobacillus sucicola DSM 21376 = JCM 15457 TaxID=1423806 RepID=A0A0R2DPI5_9LACO|nr:HPr kinase phosphorylase [Liquorilactobacillus sucicola DSM 21376 = JCM 15457]